ncbi:hypothetical protein PSI15_10130 [Xenorhabdus sp. PR6a]|uniref:hypothetical protein n=1 Tax=Xenorhabdus sp. PR6a TaxID=3025877 RepID=UPI002359BF3F|nr:hypothetical protein [Xenorhabdus sp. PR6a]MDC9581918.1 hypothetical protein [Xenorhabdus sp. PR6a]
MLEVHAQFNHIAMAGKGVDEVERVIRKSYGHFLKPDSKLTAIYIENVSHELIDKIDKKLGDTPEDVESNVINLSWHRNL